MFHANHAMPCRHGMGMAWKLKVRYDFKKKVKCVALEKLFSVCTGFEPGLPAEKATHSTASAS